MDEEKKPSENKISKSTSTSRSIPGIVLRIFLVLLVGGVIGAVVYFSAVGWVPYLEQKLFKPIENNQDQIEGLVATQQALESQVAFLLEDLRENQALNNQDLETVFSTAEGEIDQLRGAVETVNAYSLTQVPVILATLTAVQQANEYHISALATAQGEYLRNGFEIEQAKIIALLSRANQFLLHANYGLAEDQLVAALQILLDIDEDLDSWQRIQALELTSAIEGAIEDLPSQPVLAGSKLEIAWQLALLGFRALPTQDLTATPSPTGQESITPTPTPTPN